MARGSRCPIVSVADKVAAVLVIKPIPWAKIARAETKPKPRMSSIVTIRPINTRAGIGWAVIATMVIDHILNAG
jgi:hypothetical protein